MGSSRLPGKVLMPLAGRSVLAWVVSRAMECIELDDVIVATSIDSGDDQIVQESGNLGVSCFRGSADDVLGRFIAAVRWAGGADYVVRVTADCPLVSHEAMGSLVRETLRSKSAYGHNLYNTGMYLHVRGLPIGLGSEAASFDALCRVDEVANLQNYHREHVTRLLEEDPESFPFIFAPVPDQWFRPDYRLTLDNPRDYQILQAVAEEFGSSEIASTGEILRFLDTNTELLSLNAGIEATTILTRYRIGDKSGFIEQIETLPRLWYRQTPKTLPSQRMVSLHAVTMDSTQTMQTLQPLKKVQAGLVEHNKPWITPEDMLAVNEPMRSSWMARGAVTLAVESILAESLTESLAESLVGSLAERQSKKLSNRDFRVLCTSSGTASLHLALEAIRIMSAGNRKEVIIPSYGCSALYNAIVMAGLQPVVCDIARDSLCMSVESLGQCLSLETLAVIAVHTFGAAAPVADIRALMDADGSSPGFDRPWIIEDCAMALGTEVYDGCGKTVKAGSLGDVSIFSFHATKPVAGGGGGAVASSFSDFMDTASDLLDYDMPAALNRRFNHLPNDLELAPALSHLKRLDRILRARRIFSDIYREIIPGGRGVGIQSEGAGISSFGRFVILASRGLAKRILHGLNERGIGAINPMVESELIHSMAVAYGAMKPKVVAGGCPHSLWASRGGVSLPVSPGLGLSAVKTAASALKSVFAELKLSEKREVAESDRNIFEEGQWDE
jgi:spore coat polysaccharide biosynthesis protein SpsF